MKTKLKMILTAVNLAGVGLMLAPMTGCSQENSSPAVQTSSSAQASAAPAEPAKASASDATSAGMIRLVSSPIGSKVRIEGDSSIHEWQMESSLIGGSVEVGPDFPLKSGAQVKPGKMDVKCSAYITVSQFKSIEKDGSPYSAAMDDRMYQAMKAADHPKINYNLTEFTLKEAPKSAEAPYVFEAKGELCIAGVTNKISMPVSVTVVAENKVKISGSQSIKMTDFKIEPPALTVAGVGITTKDEVKLIFDWTVRKSAAKPK
jgi:hypothetical protein